MIGQYSLYDSMVATSLPEKEGDLGSRNAYKERTLDKIADRYYYHAQLCRLRYDDCLMQLNLEFDLTSRTLVEKLRLRMGYLETLANEGTTVADLRRKWPFYDWSRKPLICP